jgi:hypothetical protein
MSSTEVCSFSHADDAKDHSNYSRGKKKNKKYALAPFLIVGFVEGVPDKDGYAPNGPKSKVSGEGHEEREGHEDD